jgi:hypothetical protein
MEIIKLYGRQSDLEYKLQEERFENLNKGIVFDSRVCKKYPIDLFNIFSIPRCDDYEDKTQIWYVKGNLTVPKDLRELEIQDSLIVSCLYLGSLEYFTYHWVHVRLSDDQYVAVRASLENIEEIIEAMQRTKAEDISYGAELDFSKVQIFRKSLPLSFSPKNVKKRLTKLLK